MVHAMDSGSVTNSKVKEKKTTAISKGVGSRRIFSPMFKLQVLDSYRRDADCQGNQRATARKYGIHRRQIQKWLQMEQNLRLSVQLTNATALNLSPARQPDGGIKCNAASVPCEVKQMSPIIYNSDSNDSNNNPTAGGEASDSEEYVNVDEITDSEDDETNSCSSYERTDKALDLTCATLSKRRFYTSDFKLHVLEAFKNDKTCKGDQKATARKFGIRRRQVQKWMNGESLVKSEPTFSNACLDLTSHKRKHEESVDISECKRKLVGGESQESALCLVKSKVEPVENNDHHRILHSPSALEHSYSNTSLNCSSPDYPLYVYQPWSCCYPEISPIRNTLDTTIPKYSYALNFKYEMSYVDIPVQYGFGDSVPSEWIKEQNPFCMYEPSTIQVLSSYR